MEVMEPHASKHVLALVFFGCMLLPVSGLIRHGIVTGGADRYAYLTTISAVPYAGYAVAHLLFRGNNTPNENRRLAAPAWDAPERKAPRSARYSNKQANISNTSLARTSKAYWWVIWLLLSGTLLSISTSLLSHWRNEDSLYEYSLRTDPSDWKIYGQRAEYLLRVGRCRSDNIECRQLWTLAYQFSPRGILKSELYRLHLLVALGDNDRACDGYFALLKDNAENSSVHNNVAVCLAMRGMLDDAHAHFYQALQRSTITETMATHIRNSQEFHEWEEAQRKRSGPYEGSGFVGTMTY
ncbi:hypothetical protein ON010_g15833 [Phytophthora cinnamomi]|nr:hypothetical protein ON010_g15833 [Phytophthora cinnamomi]